VAKIFVEGPMHAQGLALLNARSDIEFSIAKNLSPDVLKAGIRDADALILRLSPLSADAVEAAEHLKVVSRYGVGYDHVDVDALIRKGIPLAIVGNALSASLAEHTLLLMLSVSRQVTVMDQATRAGNYGIRFQTLGHEIFDKTVLLVGLGKIGQAVATRCKAFGMNIIATGRQASQDAALRLGYEFVTDFRDALPRADFVSLHLPAKVDGSPLLGPDEFAAIKQGAYVINTARGSLIDEAALYSALTEGKLRGAGLDVTQDEPPARDCPLLTLDNIVFTPHNSALTEETGARVSEICVRNALAGLDGELKPANVVNGEIL
jgi:D-3-phosphoglycerate dehydrogenase